MPPDHGRPIRSDLEADYAASAGQPHSANRETHPEGGAMGAQAPIARDGTRRRKIAGRLERTPVECRR